MFLSDFLLMYVFFGITSSPLGSLTLCWTFLPYAFSYRRVLVLLEVESRIIADTMLT